MQTVTIPQALQIALQHHQTARLAEAESIYRQILVQEPAHADALHLLGVISHQTGRNELALDLIRRAIALNPAVADYHSNLGVVLTATGQLHAAVAAYREAIAIKADCAGTHNNLGSALRIVGRPDEAITACRRAIELDPAYVQAHHNLGAALRDMGRLDEAIGAYRRAAQLQPDSADVRNNLGVALKDAGKFDEAIAEFRTALQLKPDSPEAHNNLGATFRDRGRLDEAIAAYQRAIQVKPDYATALNNLGAALGEQGRIDEALATSRRALDIKPDFAEACNTVANALKDLGRVDDAIAACRRGIETNPGFARAHSNLLFFLHYLPEIDAAELFREHGRWNDVHARPLSKFIAPHRNDRGPDRRLRIGYVSPDFRAHSVGFFIECLLAHHDGNEVEVFCYADVLRADSFTVRFQQHVRHWRNIASVSDAQAAGQIREDRIDILVDLSGHTARNRLLIFARKPAPIQVTWLGYPDTTGVSTIDYRLTDAYADPPGVSEHLHTERLVRLPDVFACFRPADVAPQVDPLPALARGHVTFASFHTLAKLNDPLLERWARILQRVPNSRLLMIAYRSNDGSVCRRFIEFLASRGIAAHRIEFKGHQLPPQYLALHNEVDVMLDSQPFSGHTVACHALWMGVPVVTLAGERHCSRMVASVLASLGLPELIARTRDEYVKIAADLAANVPRLAEMRSTLRERMRASPVTDAQRFTRAVEHTYREMWRTWCA